MQTYDAFAARVSDLGDACGDGRTDVSSDDRGPTPQPSTSRDDARLATLPECYDAYVSLHRGGLWFDINPFWHPELRCYYLRCEPNRATEDSDARGEDATRARGATRAPASEAAARRGARAVIVPVAKSRGRVSHATLREVSRLGEAWRRETERIGRRAPSAGADASAGSERTPSIDGTDGTDDDGFRTVREAEDVSRSRTRDATRDGFAGDPPPAFATSLCVVDTDGVAVVLRVARGLVEPEECDAAAKDDDATTGFADDDAAFDEAPRVESGRRGASSGATFAASDDEDDLDERDAFGRPEPERGV